MAQLTSQHAAVVGMYLGTGDHRSPVVLWSYWATCRPCGWRGSRFRHPTYSGLAEAEHDCGAHNMNAHPGLATAEGNP